MAPVFSRIAAARRSLAAASTLVSFVAAAPEVVLDFSGANNNFAGIYMEHGPYADSGSGSTGAGITAKGFTHSKPQYSGMSSFAASTKGGPDANKPLEKPLVLLSDLEAGAVYTWKIFALGVDANFSADESHKYEVRVRDATGGFDAATPTDVPAIPAADDGPTGDGSATGQATATAGGEIEFELTNSDSTGSMTISMVTLNRDTGGACSVDGDCTVHPGDICLASVCTTEVATGENCATDDCTTAGDVCHNNLCTVENATGESCSADADCTTALDTCVGSVCTAPSAGGNSDAPRAAVFGSAAAVFVAALAAVWL